MSLNPLILFGTSSWNYEGWKGFIYKKEYKNEKDFKQNSLGEYAEHPDFRTVGIDSSFYGPLRPSTLENYASQVPENFTWVQKAWEEITVPFFGKHPRYGQRAGKANPNFLNAELFADSVLENLKPKEIKKHCGPIVFQFQNIPRGQAEFLDSLNSFLEKLPKDFQYATEVRNPELLNKTYFQALNNNGATHCFNHWTNMPPLVEQMKAAASAGGLEAEFYVSRILTPLGVSYADAVKRFSPYSDIQMPNPQMRADVVRLAKRAITRKSKAYIIVNNRSEGCSPKSIHEMAKLVSENTE